MLRKITTLLKEILIELIVIRIELRRITAPQLPVKEELLDNSDAMRLLKISEKTLYRWRKEKLIRTRIIGNKHYYLKADLVKLIEIL